MPAEIRYTRIKVGGLPVCDAADYMSQLASRPAWADKVNTLECPIGKDAGHGMFLISKASADALAVDSSVDIAWSWGVVGGAQQTLTFTGYVVTRVVEAIAADQSQYLVSVADPRRHYQHSAVAKRYNVRYSIGDEFYDDTENGAAPWTWQEMVADLAAEVQGTGGTVFTLATLPTGTPENLIFDGESAWDALVEIADLTNHAVSYEPFIAEAQSHELGVPQGTVQADIAALANVRQSNPKAAGFGNAPANIRVFFNWRPGEGNNWLPKEPHYIDNASGVSGAAPGFAVAWSPMLAEPDLITPSAPPINIADMAIEATNIAKRESDRYFQATDPDYYRFSGLHDFTPGSEIESVRWMAQGAMTSTEVRFFKPKPNVCCRKRYPKHGDPFSASGYIAEVPEDGIPARVGVVPGTVQCELWRTDETTGDIEKVIDTLGGDVKVDVLNLSAAEITKEYVELLRDWQGQWWALFGGEGTQIIQFTIVSVSENTASVTINEIPCGAGEVPGLSSTCATTVVDTMGCLILKVDLKGWAAWVEPCSGGDCYWSIFSLCCV